MTTLSILASISQVLLLSPLFFILRIVSAILLPVTVTIRHVSRLLSFFLYLPFTLIPRLEAIYIFCGTAAIIGVLTGAFLGLTTHIFAGVFGLYDEPEANIATSQILPRGTPKKQASPLRPINPALGQQPHTPTSRMLCPPSIPTILEEEDEDLPFLPGNQVRRRRDMIGNPRAIWVDASDGSSDL